VNALQLAALATVANRVLSTQDLFVAVFIIMSLEVVRRSLSRGSEITRTSADERLAGMRSAARDSRMMEYRRQRLELAESDIGSDDPSSSNSSDGRRQSQRFHQTDEQYEDSEIEHIGDALKVSLSNLNKARAENAHLRDELQSIKKTIGRDHQAAIYRKDIELFALRKANQQKEDHIKERETKLESIYRQHRATLDQKEARIRALEHRITSCAQTEIQETRDVTCCDGNNERQAAVQVKLLRIKGRKSQEEDRELEEKRLEISKLKEDITALQNGSDNYTRLQDELRRAWDATHETQSTLNEERRNHAHTINMLQEATIRLEEEIRKSQKSSPARLPTIEESDKQELEAMFNAAQQDNLRLYAELETVEKRLREANQRVSADEQELEAVREQLRLEKAINADMETARPSLVHRVHFQRMEGQLKEARAALEIKEDEIKQLKATVIAKESQVATLKAAMDTERNGRTALKSELERVKESVVELETTKKQLMLDHERLARLRSRNREVSKDMESSRFSGATLIMDPSNPVQHTTTAWASRAELELPVPVPPAVVADESTILTIDETPVEASTPDPAPAPVSAESKASKIPDRIPHSPTLIPFTDNRRSRRKSLTLKGFMRRMAGKEAKEGKSDKFKDDKKDAGALAPKDKNASIRPRTSAAQALITGISKDAGATQRPKTVASQTAFSQGQQQIERAKSVTHTREAQSKSEKESRRPRSAMYLSKTNLDGHVDADATKLHPNTALGEDETAPTQHPTQRPTTAESGQSRQTRLPTIRVWTASGNS
jgi:hypothetical protein